MTPAQLPKADPLPPFRTGTPPSMASGDRLAVRDLGPSAVQALGAQAADRPFPTRIDGSMEPAPQSRSPGVSQPAFTPDIVGPEVAPAASLARPGAAAPNPGGQPPVLPQPSLSLPGMRRGDDEGAGPASPGPSRSGKVTGASGLQDRVPARPSGAVSGGPAAGANEGRLDPASRGRDMQRGEAGSKAEAWRGNPLGEGRSPDETARVWSAGERLDPAAGPPGDRPGEPAVPEPALLGLADDAAPDAGRSRPVPAEAAHRLAREIAEHPALGREGVAEMRLATEELGDLRLQVEQGEGGLRLIIEAARPETADLLRRHVEALRQELRAEGLGEVGVSIGGSANPGEGGRGGEDRPRADPPAGPPRPAPPPSASPARAPDGQLDLRL